MSEANTPQGLTLDQAYEQLHPSRESDSQEEQSEELVDGVVEDAEELEDGSEEVDQEDSEQDSEEDDDQEAEEGEESEEGSEEEEVFEVEVEGETIDVTGEELVKGYLRHNDYTRKRQADAKVARELEASYNEKLSQLDTALSTNISAEQQRMQAIQQQYGKETDQATQQSLHYQYLQLQQSLQARNTQQQQLVAHQQQQTSAVAEAYFNEQQGVLNDMYEDWGARGPKLKGYLEGVGFSDFSPFVDAKMAELVDKARQFDDLQQTRDTVVKKKLKRKVPKTVKAAQGEKKFKADQRQVNALAGNFSESRSIDDAMALLRAKRGNK